jgi:hypothetical protein
LPPRPAHGRRQPTTTHQPQNDNHGGAASLPAPGERKIFTEPQRQTVIDLLQH